MIQIPLPKEAEASSFEMIARITEPLLKGPNGIGTPSFPSLYALLKPLPSRKNTKATLGYHPSIFFPTLDSKLAEFSLEASLLSPNPTRSRLFLGSQKKSGLSLF
jgi:hypothetical protein